MNILFRVDAGPDIGLGHLMRCLALAQALVDRQAEVYFCVSESTLPLCRARHDWVGRVHVLESHLNASDELEVLEAFVVKHNVALVVLDGYHFDQPYRRKLAGFSCKVACFDDGNFTGRLHCDLVINGASERSGKIYQQGAEGAVKCVGEQFRVLRREFSNLPAVAIDSRHSLTITLGGSDPKNLTIPLLVELEKAGFAGQIRVLTGAAFPHLNQLKAFLQDSQLTVQHIHDCQQVADVFLNARLTISAAGSSQFELMCAGSPAILLVVADNQRQATQQAATQGWCKTMNVNDSSDTQQIARLAIELWQEQRRLQQMSFKAYDHADSRGAERVVEAIHAMLMETAE